MEGSKPLRATLLSIDDLSSSPTEADPTTSSIDDQMIPQEPTQLGTHHLGLGRRMLEVFKGIDATGESDKDENLSEGKAQSPSLLKCSGSCEDSEVGKQLGIVPQRPVDVLIFEGWFLGFLPLEEEVLSKHLQVIKDRGKLEDDKGRQAFRKDYDTNSIRLLNNRLRDYKDSWYGFIDCFVQLVPFAPYKMDEDHSVASKPFNIHLAWCLDAKNRQGDGGLEEEEELIESVARLMPLFELYSEGICEKGQRWTGKSLRISLDQSRDICDISSL
ncbi:hypothetical protein IE53DRAFT_155200 [Violaceomyces palustris]|uniref:Uncharacterized protein n=1 Tax=Violaceomyces palustris TaxID=1673888 RepID=A0ACD0NTV1_9BASI|nr:hypothetical protein IE53DRAFT_155200 [Violaceomyces palustris]